MDCLIFAHFKVVLSQLQPTRAPFYDFLVSAAVAECKAGPFVPRKHKGRGPAKGEAMLREVVDSSKIRIPFHEETLTFKGLDPNGTWIGSASITPTRMVFTMIWWSVMRRVCIRSGRVICMTT